MGWAATGVAFLGGAIGASYTSGSVSQALRATSHGAAAIAGFIAAEKTLLNAPKRIPRGMQRGQIEQARARSVLGAGASARDMTSASGSGAGQRRLLFSVTR
ncbi:MAG: hypothetical protein Q8P23_00875 [bacterium]|nr:hypothetical protein [bacterium]